MRSRLKYSVIIPSFNGMPFLESAISSILSSERQDFELIVSDDSSSDGSSEFLASIRDSRLRVYRPATKLSMSEHWDWAAQWASGDWQMFLGQDDALQDYFFALSDHLTRIAEETGHRAICGRRAFLNWPGLEPSAPDQALLFRAAPSITSRNTALDRWLALLSVRSYHSLPQMYTSCLVARSLVLEIRRIQKSNLVVSQPQDAGLAASITKLEKKYLVCETPFSWVGTSRRSAGKAIIDAANTTSDSETQLTAKDYLGSVASSSISYPSYAGDFSLGDNGVYFWQANIRVDEYFSGKSRPPNKLLLFLVLSAGYVRVKPFSKSFFKRSKLVRKILQTNKMPIFLGRLSFTLASCLGFPLIRMIRFLRRYRNQRANLNRFDRNAVVVPYGQGVSTIADANAMTMAVFQDLCRARPLYLWDRPW